jgi:3-deoxy-D-arabino-heptulosonate 7-phosphate (DAHP) synthase
VNQYEYSKLCLVDMLFLNEQRVVAIDNLHRVEREKEILIARANILEAEIEAGAIEREVSERNLQLLKSEANKNKGNTQSFSSC